jgi:hypothetical protein
MIACLTPRPSYAGTYSGVFKSTNGGAAWSAVNKGVPITSIWSLTIDRTSPKTVYASTDYGVCKTTDGGASWSAVNSGLPAVSYYVSSLAIDPASSQTVYLGTSLGLYKSINGGGSWSKINNALDISSLAIDPVTPQTVYAGSSNISAGGVLKSTDGGGSWSTINSGLPSYPWVIALVIDPSSPHTLYAGTEVAGVLKGLSDQPFPTISGTPITNGTVGAAYSFTPSAAATGFSITGSLPPGLKFNTANGTVSGIPTTAGSYGNIVISASIGTQTVSLPPFAIKVAMPQMPTISGVPAPTVIVGKAYSFNPSATDAISFKISGTLPPGLTFNTVNGALSGGPTMVGSYGNLVISATNSAGTVSLTAFSITVQQPMPTISGVTLSAALLGINYSFTPNATNATSFSIAGTLPPGLNFDTTTGTLSGIPTGVGSYDSIVISATNSTGTVSLPAFPILVTASLPPTISGTPATTAFWGMVYSFIPTVTNANGFTLAGSLPPGIVFNAETGALSGVPTGTGTFNNIVVTAHNSSGSASLPAFSILVQKPGDCDHDGAVTISEVQSAINMFLGMRAVTGCVDLDGSGAVSIAEVQKVINAFLGL